MMKKISCNLAFLTSSIINRATNCYEDRLLALVVLVKLSLQPEDIQARKNAQFSFSDYTYYDTNEYYQINLIGASTHPFLMEPVQYNGYIEFTNAYYATERPRVSHIPDERRSDRASWRLRYGDRLGESRPDRCTLRTRQVCRIPTSLQDIFRRGA